jgi:hypothetical protein
MSMRNVVIALGTALPLFMMPLGQKPAMAQSGLTGVVNQVSDLLVTRINSGTCADFANLIGQVKDSGAKPVDSTSTIGKLIAQVGTNDQLKSIVVSKVGPAMVNRLFACNMIPLDALTPPPGTTPAAPTPGVTPPAPTSPAPASTPAPVTPTPGTPPAPNGTNGTTPRR